MKYILFILLLLINFTFGEKIQRSIKDVLLNGPAQMKLHALAMITQGKINDELDESYLDAFEKCIQEDSIPVKLTIAKILSKHYVDDSNNISQKTVALLITLSKDENNLIAETAITEGLMKLDKKNKKINQIIKNFKENLDPS